MGQTLAREMATERQEVVDLKLVRHPGILPEDKTKWADWKFSFVYYMMLVDDRYSDELNGAETLDKLVQPKREDPEQMKRSKVLYSVASRRGGCWSWTTNRACRLGSWRH